MDFTKMFRQFKRKRPGYSFYAWLNILCKLAQSSYTIKTLFSTVQPMIFTARAMLALRALY